VLCCALLERADDDADRQALVRQQNKVAVLEAQLASLKVSPASCSDPVAKASIGNIRRVARVGDPCCVVDMRPNQQAGLTRGTAAYTQPSPQHCHQAPAHQDKATGDACVSRTHRTCLVPLIPRCCLDHEQLLGCYKACFHSCGRASLTHVGVSHIYWVSARST
jgi:hypothetical protein